MLKGLFQKSAEERSAQHHGGPLGDIDPTRMPRHIAIIMDGNGRWATQRGMPRLVGHRYGIESLREVVKACIDLGVQILTVYAFSTENWGRPQEEVKFILGLLEQVIDNEVGDLHQRGVQIRLIGRRTGLTPELERKIVASENLTRGNDRLILNVCFNYGGRAEIVDAVNRALQMARRGELGPDEEMTESLFSELVYTRGLPDPDLLIRTGGESRISNFLLWQVAYAEIWLTQVRWPDFRREHLLHAIADFQRRERRFGKV